MHILVTGGTGFLGKATALRLQREGHRVTILGRNSKAAKSLVGISFVQADLSEREKVIHACSHQDAVVHCAALASPSGAYPAFYQANVVGTQHVIEGCLKAKVKRLVNISSPSVYFDYHHRLNIRESDPLPKKQATFYGATKILADEEVRKAGEAGLSAISLRPRAIFGPEDKNILGRLIQTARRGNFPVINGGSSYVDMTYIDNVVDAIVLALNADTALSGRTYNISNGEPIQSRQMLETLFGKLRLNVRLVSLPYFVAYALGALLEFTNRLTGSR